MERKILKTAVLLAQYQDAIDGVQMAYDRLDTATYRRDRLHRDLVALIGRAELMDIMNQEPTDVENPR